MIWPAARSAAAAGDVAAAALSPTTTAAWARILRQEIQPAEVGEALVMARSFGLAQVAGVELSFAPAPAFSARRLMAVASEVMDHVIAHAPPPVDGPMTLESGRVCHVATTFDRAANAVEMTVKV